MLDVVVDELTKSITEVATGRSYATLISLATLADLNAAATNWQFDWVQELTKAEVYKLTAPKLGRLIHGLVSLTRSPNFILVNIVESHPENIGRGEKYAEVAGNLIAYAAKLSFELGLQGVVAWDAKSELIEHYREKFGAVQVGHSQRMFLRSSEAQRLVDQYFGGKHEEPRKTGRR
ncbi:MAG: hypothetical protein IAG10_28970 [Planctomycetaceae bacterium]|nr:hypothetical protein [Planctomycetaceae bacterium]